MNRWLFACALVASPWLSAGATTPTNPNSNEVCPPGFFRLADGSGVDIAPAAEGTYRWRKPDGRTGLLAPRPEGDWASTLGWTDRPDGIVVDLSNCRRGHIRFAGKRGRRVPFDIKEVSFPGGKSHPSEAVNLAGRLTLPVGQQSVPIVVLVHGSEDSSALDSYALQRLLPSVGIGTFVYDKRGTGKSEGSFTHDLYQLAMDATAARATATAAAGSRAGAIGYYGTSQGGWTAPLAASFDHADFVIAGYGLAVSPMSEDSEALALDMTRHGFGEPEIAKAQRIGRAAQAIVRQRFQRGYAELRALMDDYRDEPWLRFVRGNITGIILKTPESELRTMGPKLLNGVIPDYDPMAVLRELPTPQLWILGAEDIDAPYLETWHRLENLKASGRPISVAVYPDAEHGLYRFETRDGERLSTRQPESLIQLLSEFARDQRIRAKHRDLRWMP